MLDSTRAFRFVMRRSYLPTKIARKPYTGFSEKLFEQYDAWRESTAEEAFSVPKLAQSAKDISLLVPERLPTPVYQILKGYLANSTPSRVISFNPFGDRLGQHSCFFSNFRLLHRTPCHGLYRSNTLFLPDDCNPNTAISTTTLPAALKCSRCSLYALSLLTNHRLHPPPSTDLFSVWITLSSQFHITSNNNPDHTAS